MGEKLRAIEVLREDMKLSGRLVWYAIGTH